jgi:hypothetical protein
MRTVDLTLDLKNAKSKSPPEQRAQPMSRGPSIDCGGGFKTHTTQTNIRHKATGGTWQALELNLAKTYLNAKTGKQGCFAMGIPKNCVGNVARAINKLSMFLVILHRATSAKNATALYVLHKDFLASLKAYAHLTLESRDNIDLVWKDVKCPNGDRNAQIVGTIYSCGGGYRCFIMETTMHREGEHTWTSSNSSWTSYEIHIEKSYTSKTGVPSHFTMSVPARHVPRVRLALSVHAVILGEGQMLMHELENVLAEGRKE